MSEEPAPGGGSSRPKVLQQAPAELLDGRLQRVGEGVGQVVYGSEHWVVKRPRSHSGVISVIVVWKLLHQISFLLPGSWGQRLLHRPSWWIRMSCSLLRPLVAVVPKSFWLKTGVGDVWGHHHWHDVRGRHLAQAYLAGTPLVPGHVIFPPVRVKLGRWPRRLIVSEATEKVEATLIERLRQLSREGRFEEIEKWLERYLQMRQAAWRRGIFSMDAHLKNFGVIGDRVVLLDTGGLTDDWPEVDGKLLAEQAIVEPHVRLGLGPLLADRPDIAERFNLRWREVVSHETLLRHWPT